MGLDIRQDGVHIQGPEGATVRVGMAGDIEVTFVGGGGVSWVCPDGLEEYIHRLTAEAQGTGGDGVDRNKPTVRGLLLQAVEMIDHDAGVSGFDRDMSEEKELDSGSGEHAGSVATGVADAPSPDPASDPFAHVDGDYQLIEDPDQVELAQAIADKVTEEVTLAGLNGASMRRMQKYVDRAEALRDHPEEFFLVAGETGGGGPQA